MLKHIETMVVDKSTGAIIHDLKRTCQLDVKEDFDDYIHRLADGFCRLIKSSSENVIVISCEDYKNPEQKFIFPDVYQ